MNNDRYTFHRMAIANPCRMMGYGHTNCSLVGVILMVVGLQEPVCPRCSVCPRLLSATSLAN